MDIGTAITLMLALVDNLGRVSAVIAAARAEGRTHLSPDEWAGLLRDADAARAALGTADLYPTTPAASPPAPAVRVPGADLFIPDGT